MLLRAARISPFQQSLVREPAASTSRFPFWKTSISYMNENSAKSTSNGYGMALAPVKVCTLMLKKGRISVFFSGAYSQLNVWISTFTFSKVNVQSTLMRAVLGHSLWLDRLHGACYIINLHNTDLWFPALRNIMDGWDFQHLCKIAPLRAHCIECGKHCSLIQHHADAYLDLLCPSSFSRTINTQTSTCNEWTTIYHLLPKAISSMYHRSVKTTASLQHHASADVLHIVKNRRKTFRSPTTLL